MLAMGIDFVSFYDFPNDFGIVPKVWYFLFFILLQFVMLPFVTIVTVVVVIVQQLDLQLPMQSMPITTDAVSSNLDQGERTKLCDKVFSDLRQVGGFLRVLRFPPIDKTDSHDITEILLKVALNTIKHTNILSLKYQIE